MLVSWVSRVCAASLPSSSPKANPDVSTFTTSPATTHWPNPFVNIVSESFKLNKLKYSQEKNCYTFDLNYYIKNYGKLPAIKVQSSRLIAHNINFDYREKYYPDKDSL